MFSRREKTSQTSAAPTSTATSGGQETGPGGKGRPTPTRKEAEQQRKERIKPNNNMKSISKNARLRAVEERRAQREGLMRGDERHLPKRDKGPVKGYIRDFVDVRTTAAEFFLPLAAVVLTLSVVNTRETNSLATSIWAMMVLFIGVDSLRFTRKMRKEITRQFPDEPRRGTVPYAMMRALTYRRFRTPKPRLPRGAKLAS